MTDKRDSTENFQSESKINNYVT